MINTLAKSMHCHLLSYFNISHNVQHTLLRTERHRLNITFQGIKKRINCPIFFVPAFLCHRCRSVDIFLNPNLQKKLHREKFENSRRAFCCFSSPKPPTRKMIVSYARTVSVKCGDAPSCMKCSTLFSQSNNWVTQNTQ